MLRRHSLSTARLTPCRSRLALCFTPPPQPTSPAYSGESCEGLGGGIGACCGGAGSYGCTADRFQCVRTDECNTNPCGGGVSTGSQPGCANNPHLGYTCTCGDHHVLAAASIPVLDFVPAAGKAQTCQSSTTGCADLQCRGIDYCSEIPAVPHSTCNNDDYYDAGFTVECDTGWEAVYPSNTNVIPQSCADINECEDPGPGCTDFANCENTDGSFSCSCPPGTQFDGSAYPLLTLTTATFTPFTGNAMGLLTLDETPDLRGLVDVNNDNRLRSETRLAMTVVLTDVNRYPTVFELMRVNNRDGVKFVVPAPADGWAVGVNYVDAAIPNPVYKLPASAGSIGWQSMTRLELHMNARTTTGWTITIGDMRLTAPSGEPPPLCSHKCPRLVLV